MSQKLKDRILSYQSTSDFKILPKLPLIISINGRNFNKITSFLEKPYDTKFTECMLATTLNLVSEVEGCFFAYQYNDEIVLVTKNDQNTDTSPWCDNKLQKINSIVASLATFHFNESCNSMQLNISGNAIFTSNIFAVPTLSEAVNTIIFKQQHNFLTSIQFSCFYELLKHYDKNEIKNMLNGLTIDEKINFLKEELNIEFNDYPQIFRRGAACYKATSVQKGILKSKWTLDSELPIFSQDQSFLTNIFKNGSEIFRNE